MEGDVSLDEALKNDISTVLPFGGGFRSVDAITAMVAPLRGREVRAALNAMAKSAVLDLVPGGGGKVALYGRQSIRRQV
jgi:hypothetical protein